MVNKFIKAALSEANKAFIKEEIPVGAVIVYNNKIIARGHNNREGQQNLFGHAEINVLKKATKKIKSWRLEDCDMYITLEPCAMCVGAIMQARIRNVYFGAYDKKGGFGGSIMNLFDYSHNHNVSLHGGIMEEECRLLLQEFFQSLRKKQKNID